MLGNDFDELSTTGVVVVVVVVEIVDAVSDLGDVVFVVAAVGVVRGLVVDFVPNNVSDESSLQSNNASIKARSVRTGGTFVVVVDVVVVEASTFVADACSIGVVSAVVLTDLFDDDESEVDCFVVVDEDDVDNDDEGSTCLASSDDEAINFDSARAASSATAVAPEVDRGTLSASG